MMEWFYEHFPEVAERETRTATLIQRNGQLPPGEYTFIELYCTEPGCDCTNVMFNVVERSKGHLATINHGLQEDSFTRGSFKDIGGPRTFLDPLNKQSKYSQALLELFEKVLLSDSSYVERLRKHWGMVREKVNREGLGTKQESRNPFQKLIQKLQMMPCPCGSGIPCAKCNCSRRQARLLRDGINEGLEIAQKSVEKT